MDTLYHVTFKNRIDSIKENGIMCIEGMEVYSSYIKKHPNSIYAFITIEDALKWCDFTIKHGEYLIEKNGEPIIIEFIDDTSKYDFDSHWQMKEEFSSAVYKKQGEYVKPEQIKQVIDYKCDKKELSYEEWKNNYI